MNHNIILKPGDTLSATVEAIVTPPVNIPPIASAGTDKTIKLPVSEVTLTGAVSDPDGLTSDLTVKWTGPGTIATPTAITTKVTGLTEGTHTFKLTVSDKKGGVTADDVTITVLKADVVTPPAGKIDYMNLPIVGAQDFSGKSNILFENKRIVNADISIKMYNGANNITIRNCFFDGAAKELVELENAKNITIENCLFAKGFAGVYAVGSSNIIIRNCQFVNMKIRWINGNFSGRGVFTQFNGCNTVEVSGCKGENFAEADPEDMVSMYKTSNAVIKNNMFRGNPQSNWSASGGGIIGGDNGGDNIVIEGNSLMTPGNYGVALAGGSNSKILNNKIYSERNAVSNNPLYTWGQGVPLSNITVSGNKVYWIDKNGSVNRGWNAGGTNVNYNPAENGSLTLAELNMPAHLIDFVTPAELLKIRGK
jgi:parallel beta-helix repeat protein